jgi:ATP-dependent exoDNAse (exonuclease V) alpha subunit
LGGKKVVHFQNKDVENMIHTPPPKILRNIYRVDFDRQCVFNGSVGIVMKVDQEDESFYVLYPGNVFVREISGTG